MSDIRDRCVNFAALFRLLDVHLKLKRRFSTLLILGPDLGVPGIPGVELDIENKDDIAGLSLLSNNYLFRAIDDEVATLIIQALLIF